MAAIGQKIKIFRKNLIDLDKPNVFITITDPAATDLGTTDFLRNRLNTSAWGTTGSVDATPTIIDVDFGDATEVDHILLLGHNFKDYLVEYWDGAVYVQYGTASITGNLVDDTFHEAEGIITSKIRITVNATIIVDDDKVMKQLIITQGVLSGQLENFMKIKKPTHNREMKIQRMLSGRINRVQGRGSFKVELNLRWNTKENDLDMVEDIFERREGVLVWLCGGNEDQFLTKRLGYRLKDIYLMGPVNDYVPEYDKSIYVNGMKTKIKFEEVVF